MANQFVVELKNDPGGLAILAEALAERGIDLRAIGGGGIGDTGHIIMTTADDDGARAVLEAGGYTFIEGESILTEVDDRPGGMARLSRAAGRCRREHLRPPLPRPLGRSGDVRVRRRRPRQGPPDPRTQGLTPGAARPGSASIGYREVVDTASEPDQAADADETNRSRRSPSAWLAPRRSSPPAAAIPPRARSTPAP